MSAGQQQKEQPKEEQRGIIKDAETPDVNNRNTATYIVGIDVGSRRSGTAFAHEDRPTEIFMKQTEKPKELTAVLLNANKEFVAYGEAAQKKYVNMEPEEQANMYYIEAFKMALWSIKDGVRPTLTDMSGKEIGCVVVIAAVLQYFKTKALAQIQDGLAKDNMRPFRVRYVITIPAIWDNPAKQIMREAAVKAGLAKSMNDPDVVLALESEAASLSCYSLARKESGFAWVPDTRYLVADLGGGTSDYTVHRVTENQSLGQVLPASGDATGSHYINMKILNYLVELFGEGVMKAFATEYTPDYVEFLGDIEVMKASVTYGENGVEPKTQRIPAPLIALLEKKASETGANPKTFVDLLCTRFNVSRNEKKDQQKNVDVKEKNKTGASTSATASPNAAASPKSLSTDDWEDVGPEPNDKKNDKANPEAPKSNASNPPPFVRHRNGRLVLEKLFIEDVFRDIVAANVAELERILALTKLNYVFLVGGFARSEVVQNAFRAVLKKHNKISLIIPPHMDQAVLLGAVRYGLNPTVITSRVMPYCYGVQVMRTFTDEHKRDGQVPKLFQRTGKDNVTRHEPHCNTIFLPLVKAGAEIGWNQTIKRIYTPGEDNDTDVTIAIYRAPGTVKYVTDPSSKLVGHLQVLMPDQTGGIDRHARATYYFGATEIRISAVDVNTGKEFETSISFFGTFAFVCLVVLC